MKKSTVYSAILATFIITLLFFACKKEHHHDTPEPETINIAIYSPVEAHEYKKGDTVFIKAKITSPTALHGCEVHLIRKADTTEVFTKTEHGHLTSFDINEYWVNNGAKHSEMELEIRAILDHNGNTTNKKVKFHCHQH